MLDKGRVVGLLVRVGKWGSEREKFDVESRQGSLCGNNAACRVNEVWHPETLDRLHCKAMQSDTSLSPSLASVSDTIDSFQV